MPDAGALRHQLGRDRRRAGLLDASHRLHEVAHAVRQADRRDSGRADSPRGNGAQDHDLAVAVTAARPPEGCRADGADAGVDGEVAQHARGDRSGARCARHSRRRRHQHRVLADPSRAQSGKRHHVRRHGDRSSVDGRPRSSQASTRSERCLARSCAMRSRAAAATRVSRAAPTRPSTITSISSESHAHDAPPAPLRRAIRARNRRILSSHRTRCK